MFSLLYSSPHQSSVSKIIEFGFAVDACMIPLLTAVCPCVLHAQNPEIKPTQDALYERKCNVSVLINSLTV